MKTKTKSLTNFSVFKVLRNASGWRIYEEVSIENKPLINCKKMVPARIRTQDYDIVDQYVTFGLTECDLRLWTYSISW